MNEVDLARFRISELQKQIPEASLATCVAKLTASERAAWLSQFNEAEQQGLEYEWAFWARPAQLAPKLLPDGTPWRYWVVRSGRAWGKTRAGAQWVVDRVKDGIAQKIGIAARTASDIRNTLIESGKSSIMELSPPGFRPNYEPSKRRLTWPNGAVAFTFSADEPDLARGPQFDTLWGDEFSSWPAGRPVSREGSGNEFFDNLSMGLRLPTGRPGVPPQALLSSTPKPTSLVRWLSAHPKSIVTIGATNDNAANLDPEYLAEMRHAYKGTSLERQELFGEILEQAEGALWKREILQRVDVRVEDLSRVVVAVDPNATSNGAEAGIVIAGVRDDAPGKAFIVADHTTSGGPLKWSRAAVEAYRLYNADYILAETNHGGDLIEMAIREAAGDERVPVKVISASRGKASRAEPAVLLYEKGDIFHDRSSALSGLEDQMCTSIPGTKDPYDRVDALVWAIHDLLLGSRYGSYGKLPGFMPEDDPCLMDNPYDF